MRTLGFANSDPLELDPNMKRPSLRFLLIASLAAPLAVAGPSLAQAPSAGPAPAAHAGGHPWRDPAARIAARAQHLRDALQLRPDQEGALTTFIQSMKPPAGAWGHKDGEHRDGGPAERGALTTPERLDRMAAFMDKRRAAFTARAEAVKRFYAQLSPAQQKAFDTLHHGRFGHGGGEDGGFRHGPHPMGGQHGGPGEGGAPTGAE